MATEISLKKPGSDYQPDDVAAALVAVELCGGSVAAAARQTGIPERTLYRWVERQKRGQPATQERRAEAIAERVEKLKADIGERYEQNVHANLDAITPRKRKDASLRDLTWAAAVCTDKMRLMREQPPPPGRAEVAMSEAMAIAAQAMVAMAKAAGHEISEQDAAAKIREIQLDRSTLATELTQ